MFMLNVNHASHETNTSFLTFCSFSIEPIVHYFSTIIYMLLFYTRTDKAGYLLTKLLTGRRRMCMCTLADACMCTCVEMWWHGNYAQK